MIVKLSTVLNCTYVINWLSIIVRLPADYLDKRILSSFSYDNDLHYFVQLLNIFTIEIRSLHIECKKHIKIINIK